MLFYRQYHAHNHGPYFHLTVWRSVKAAVSFTYISIYMCMPNLYWRYTLKQSTLACKQWTTTCTSIIYKQLPHNHTLSKRFVSAAKHRTLEPYVNKTCMSKLPILFITYHIPICSIVWPDTHKTLFPDLPSTIEANRLLCERIARHGFEIRGWQTHL